MHLLIIVLLNTKIKLIKIYILKTIKQGLISNILKLLYCHWFTASDLSDGWALQVVLHSCILLRDSLFALTPWHCNAFHACQCYHFIVFIFAVLYSDLMYSLPLIFSYSGFMQQGIKSNPSLVQKLRATFLKVKKKIIIVLQGV